VKRWCKRPPAVRATGPARQTPPGARSSSARSRAARPSARVDRWRAPATVLLDGWSPTGTREGPGDRTRPTGQPVRTLCRSTFFYCWRARPSHSAMRVLSSGLPTPVRKRMWSPDPGCILLALPTSAMRDVGAYKRDLKRVEPPCDNCLRAAAEQSRRRYASARSVPRRGLAA
jgi:hypothetical protein